MQFWSLFSDRLVVRQVSLNRPEVVWPQNAAGEMAAAGTSYEARTGFSSRANQLPLPPATASASASPVVTTASPLQLPALPRLRGNRPLTNVFSAETPPLSLTPRKCGESPSRMAHFVFSRLARPRGSRSSSGSIFVPVFAPPPSKGQRQGREGFSPRSLFSSRTLSRRSATILFRSLFPTSRPGPPAGTISGQFEDAFARGRLAPFTAIVRFHDLQAEKLLTNAGVPQA